MPVEDRSESIDYLARPIILIGAGRSGSTLFVRMLNAHPEIQFLGETDFLTARVWREVWDNRFWLNFQHHVMRQARSSREAPVEIPPEAMDAAKERAARGVRRLLAELMQLEPGFSVWGFKEIWNGNPAVATIPWGVYQAVFPHARWVHLVRDPFTFVRSSARWNQLPLTSAVLTQELRHWQQIVEWSQRLAQLPDFFEIRFEDLVSAPEATLTPILASVRLGWHNRCARELTRRIMDSERTLPLPATRTLDHGQIDKIVKKVPGLRRSMRTFGYEPPDKLMITTPSKIRSRTVSKRPYLDLRSMKKDYEFDENKPPGLGDRLREIAKMLGGLMGVSAP